MTDIATLSQLQAINDNLAGTYVLTADIDAADTSTWNSGAGFLPIGTNANPFTGTFDGGGFTISNLFVNRPTTNYVGLFGKTSASSAPYKSIKNFTLANVNLTGKSYVGAVAGYVAAYYLLYNIICSGAVTSTGATALAAGGMVGYSAATGDTSSGIVDCASSVEVTGIAAVGGLIGYNTGSVRTSQSSGNVTAVVSTSASATGVGGFVGVQSGLTIQQCLSTGEVHGTGNCGVGGFVGYAASGSDTGACYTIGKVTGVNTGSSAGAAGGFIGRLSTSMPGKCHGCHSRGQVIGDTLFGGFVGNNLTSSYMLYINSFWDTESSQQATGFDGDALYSGTTLAGLTTAQMADVANFPINTSDGVFVNWDTSVWIFCDYPLLKWHDPTCPVVGGFWARLGGTTQTFS